MATITYTLGTSTALTFTGLTGLANATYATSNVIDLSASVPLDLKISVLITPAATIGGGKRAIIFAQGSTDNANWTGGPSSGTSALNEANLYRVGVVMTEVASSAQRKIFSLAPAFGGTLPPYVRIVVKNDTGGALGSSSINLSTVVGTIV